MALAMTCSGDACEAVAARTTQMLAIAPGSGATPTYPSERMCISPREVRPLTPAK
jgi:hypothetical protein